MSTTINTNHSSTTIPGVARSRALARWIAGGVTAVAVSAAIAVAVWPASAADRARDDGEQLGRAVAALSQASTTAEVDAALEDVHTAVADTRDHAGDAVAQQAADQEDALARALDGFTGSATAGDAFSADVYQAELDAALDDLDRQAAEFRGEGPEVQQAFWDGYQQAIDAA